MEKTSRASLASDHLSQQVANLINWQPNGGGAKKSDLWAESNPPRPHRPYRAGWGGGAGENDLQSPFLHGVHP